MGRIIHVDMDCFYAAIELRERPELEGLPVAVGGGSRGVLTTCNYVARTFGCRSAMPVFQAKRLCPDLILLPVRFELYREESRIIRGIFHEFTDRVEPLSLDEAYLDVTGLRSEAFLIASEIRQRIRERTGLAASAGIGPNKFLAKLASDWRKPDGQFEIRPEEVEAFMPELPVERLWGVGSRTAARLHALGVRTCGDLQSLGLVELDRHFGRFGSLLHEMCRGIDHRLVDSNRERKSVSSEETFATDLSRRETGLERLGLLLDEVASVCQAKHVDRVIREGFVKLKFSDFTQTTAQRPMPTVVREDFEALLAEAWDRGQGRAVRLIGAGVRFQSRNDAVDRETQLDLFGAGDPIL
ncbi:MAG: DNA polymerase IV [Verrucomicrobiales bacterium]